MLYPLLTHDRSLFAECTTLFDSSYIGTAECGPREMDLDVIFYGNPVDEYILRHSLNIRLFLMVYGHLRLSGPF